MRKTLDFWRLRVENITREVLVGLLDGTEEGQRLEFKRPITKALTAFANADGGRLVIGVEDVSEESATSRFSPVTDTRANVEKRINSFFQNCAPPLKAEFSAVDVSADKTATEWVVVVDVPPQPRSFYQASDGNFYLRSGAASVRAPYSVIVQRLSAVHERDGFGMAILGPQPARLGPIAPAQLRLDIAVHRQGASRGRPDFDFARNVIGQTAKWNASFDAPSTEASGVHFERPNEGLLWSWDGRLDFALTLNADVRGDESSEGGRAISSAQIDDVHESIGRALRLFTAVHGEISPYEELHIDVRLTSPETERTPEIRTRGGLSYASGSSSIRHSEQLQALEIETVENVAARFLKNWFLQGAVFIDDAFAKLSLN